MLTSLWAFFLGSPIKVALWLGNRLVTWTSLLFFWRRLRHAPDRLRRFLLWGAAINAVSLLALAGVLHVVLRR